MRKVSDLSSQEWDIIDYDFFMFTFPTEGDTLDLLTLAGFTFLRGVSLVGSPVDLLAPPCVEREREKKKTSKWMFRNNGGASSHQFSSEESSPKKRKIDAKMLWMYDWKCHLQDCTFPTVCLPKEYSWGEAERERFAVLYIKWCLFSILTLQVTSEGATSTGFCTYM